MFNIDNKKWLRLSITGETPDKQEGHIFCNIKDKYLLLLGSDNNNKTIA